MWGLDHFQKVSEAAPNSIFVVVRCSLSQNQNSGPFFLKKKMLESKVILRLFDSIILRLLNSLKGMNFERIGVFRFHGLIVLQYLFENLSNQKLGRK